MFVPEVDSRSITTTSYSQHHSGDVAVALVAVATSKASRAWPGVVFGGAEGTVSTHHKTADAGGTLHTGHVAGSCGEGLAAFAVHVQHCGSFAKHTNASLIRP